MTRCAPSRSAHSGSIAAFCRAHSREVSTSSAGHHELRVLPAPAPTPGEDREPGAAGAEVARAGHAPPALRSSSSPMWESSPASSAWWTPSASGVSAGAAVARRSLSSSADLAQLRLEVLPLAHAQVVEVLAPAHPAERADGQLALLLAQVAPQVEAGQEVRSRVGEAGVLLVGLLPGARPAARAGPASTAPRRSRAPRAAQPCRSASRIIRPSRGSIGSRASRRPSSGEPARGRPAGSSAPSSSSSCTPSVIVARGRAGRRTGSRRRRRGRARPSAG